MNSQKLLELADYIEELEPNQFYMADWCTSHYEVVCEKTAKEICGTACCIAGWAVLKAGLCLRGSGVEDKNHNYIGLADNVAAALLGLPGRDLFFAERWPQDYYERYIAQKGHGLPYGQDDPKLAAEVIRDYVRRHEDAISVRGQDSGGDETGDSKLA